MNIISLLQKIKQYFGRKWGGPYPYLQSQIWALNSAVYSPATYRTFALEGYMTNPVVYRCINLIATAVAGVPWLLYEKKTDNVAMNIERHPVLDLLRHPNPMLGQADFFTYLVSYLQLNGNVYIRKVGPTHGAPQELYFLRPDRVNIRMADCESECYDEFMRVYEYTCNNKKENINYHDLWHGKLWNPLCDFYGLSPLQAAAKSTDQLNLALDWNVALLQNSANPSGVLTSECNLNDIQVERLKEQLALKHQSPWNAGRPLLLDGGLKWDRTGMTPHEMEWDEGQKMATKNICVAFGVDSVLLGDSDNRTYATFKDAEKSFYTSTVLPNLDRIRDDFLNNWLLPRFPGSENLYFDYDRNAIEVLNEDQTIVWNRVISGLKEGLISINEARETIGYSEIFDEAAVDIPPEDEEEPVPIAEEGLPAEKRLKKK